MTNSKTYDHVITLKQDYREDYKDYGAIVELDGKVIMDGNPEDFYPGCHGIYEWGPFHGINGLVNAIRLTLEAKGKTVACKTPVGYFDDNFTWSPGFWPEFDLADTVTGTCLPGKDTEPKEPTTPETKAKLSKRMRELLGQLNSALTVLDGVQLEMAENCDVIDELDNADAEILEAWNDFQETIQWRKYHDFVQKLKKHTDYK